jgi:hypothetical protein
MTNGGNRHRFDTNLYSLEFAAGDNAMVAGTGIEHKR